MEKEFSSQAFFRLFSHGVAISFFDLIIYNTLFFKDLET